MRAEERLAAFLLNLVQRLHARGFSRHELVLRMTRQEIGNYLGLKLETVSRTFSRFAEDGLVEVRHRHVRILDVDKLKALLPQPA
jgi:CRP/FNR family transcriptional regulator